MLRSLTTDKVVQISFLLLAILAVIFYRERIAMTDAAYQLFVVLVGENLAVQVNRFGSAVTKIWPLAAQELGLPLRSVMIIYSLSFILYPYLLYLTITRWLKSKEMGIAVLLFATLMVGQVFFWVQSELLQGCFTLLFYFTLVIYIKELPWWILILSFPLLITLAFFHPLIPIPFLFCWLFFYLHYKELRHWRYGILAVFFVAVVLIKHFYIPSNPYDSTSISQVKNLLNDGHLFFRFHSTLNFWRYSLIDYYFFTAGFLFMGYWYIKAQKYWKLGLLYIFTLSYLVLVNGSYPWGGLKFHTESFYQVLCIFIALPLLYDLLPSWNRKDLLPVVLAGIVFIRIIHISVNSHNFTKRLQWNLELLEKTKSLDGQKFLIYEEDVPLKKLFITWGSPYETTLLSALEHPDSTRCILIIRKEVAKEQNMLQDTQTFLSSFGPIFLDQLPRQYFRIRDTTAYDLLNKNILPE